MMIPFIMSSELMEFIRWCGHDPYSLDYTSAMKWAEFYNWFYNHESEDLEYGLP